MVRTSLGVRGGFDVNDVIDLVDHDLVDHASSRQVPMPTDAVRPLNVRIELLAVRFDTPVTTVFASPDCQHFSRALGGTALAQRAQGIPSRSLVRDVVRTGGSHG